jgi:hypothetical protein
MPSRTLGMCYPHAMAWQAALLQLSLSTTLSLLITTRGPPLLRCRALLMAWRSRHAAVAKRPWVTTTWSAAHHRRHVAHVPRLTLTLCRGIVTVRSSAGHVVSVPHNRCGPQRLGPGPHQRLPQQVTSLQLAAACDVWGGGAVMICHSQVDWLSEWVHAWCDTTKCVTKSNVHGIMPVT